MTLSVNYDSSVPEEYKNPIKSIVDQLNSREFFQLRSFNINVTTIEPANLRKDLRGNPALSGLASSVGSSIFMNPIFGGNRPIVDRFLHELLHIIKPGLAAEAPVGVHPLRFYEEEKKLYDLLGRKFDVKDDVYYTDSEIYGKYLRGEPQKCFLAGTVIQMADGTTKAIEEIRPGDQVAAFDPLAQQGLGPLRPAKVKRTFTNVSRTIINLRGLHLTPGHVVLMDNG